MLAAHRDARGMNLGEAGVRECGAAFVRTPDRRDVRALRVCREIKDVAVAAGAQDHDVREMRLDLARDHVARYDAPRTPIDDNEIEHLVAREHGDAALRDFLFERLITPEEQLLSRLAAGV